MSLFPGVWIKRPDGTAENVNTGDVTDLGEPAGNARMTSPTLTTSTALTTGA